ncbi:MAG: chemotaxis protein CheW [Burkholderiaceae bacterium]
MSSTQGSSTGDGGLDLSQFHAVFFEEADENLVQFEQHLMALDVELVDSETLNAIFRCAHSIKGGAATFGFNDVTSLTHVMESLLDKLRRGELRLSRAMVDTLLESGDALKSLLAFHAGEADHAPDTRNLIEAIHRHESPGSAAAAAPAAGAPAAMAAAATVPAAAATGGADALRMTFAITVNATSIADTLAMFGEVAGMGEVAADPEAEPVDGVIRSYIVHRSKCSPDEIVEMLAFHVNADEIDLAPMSESADAAAGDDESAGEHGSGAAWGMYPQREAEVAAAAAAKRMAMAATAQAAVHGDDPAVANGGGNVAGRPVKAGAKGRGKPASGDSTLRVSVEKVDNLINLVGELVITQAMLEQNAQELDPIQHQSLLSCLAELERNTRLLQESVMAIRMIPMGVVFSRFPRMMRDLENRLGKQIELKTVGEATELDKGMIEKITDPLTHLIRNAADHGIEMPEERKRVGKKQQGTVTLSAQHRGGQICIEVSDDGKGLSRKKLIEKAIERGIPANDQMSDQDVWNLIMEPGFSTATELTDISGRGVGMDVVKKNIQSLGGSVRISSVEGRGSTISVNLPLTLAIMDGMSVGIGQGETYILPLASVIESINLHLQQIKTVGGDQNVLKLRGDYIPILDMAQMLGVERASVDRTNDTVVIVEADGKRAALVVDELIGQHQVVVKNLEQNYGRIEGVSGATILGDGRVAMILDVAHFVRRARH